jgi:hypothetical protein
MFITDITNPCQRTLSSAISIRFSSSHPVSLILFSHPLQVLQNISYVLIIPSLNCWLTLTRVTSYSVNITPYTALSKQNNITCLYKLVVLKTSVSLANQETAPLSTCMLRSHFCHHFVPLRNISTQHRTADDYVHVTGKKGKKKKLGPYSLNLYATTFLTLSIEITRRLCGTRTLHGGDCTIKTHFDKAARDSFRCRILSVCNFIRAEIRGRRE